MFLICFHLFGYNRSSSQLVGYSSLTRDGTQVPLGAWCPTHWTTMKVPWRAFYKRERLWVARVGFTFFGVRAVTGLGACCLFPQRVLAVIPLVEDAQVRGPHRLQEGGGSSWCPIPGPSAAVAVCVGLWSLKMATEAHTHPWSVCRCALLPESVWRKTLLWQSPLFLCPPPQ